MTTQQLRVYMKPNCKMLSIEEEQPICDTSINDVGYGGDLDGNGAKTGNTNDDQGDVWE